VDLGKRAKNFKMMSLIKKKRMVLVQKNMGENWIVSQMKYKKRKFMMSKQSSHKKKWRPNKMS